MRGARLTVACLFGLATAACPSPSQSLDASTPLPSSRAGLKVPLPDGWKATPGAKGLTVGPPGRAVLELESSTRAFPALAALERALGGQAVRILEKSDSVDFVGVRYSLAADGGGDVAFLGVRRVGRLTVWCASLAGAQASEVAEAERVCARLGLEASDAG
ncbi:MAG: hypothetical protein AB1938_32285 [Myxococcota bacterium]